MKRYCIQWTNSRGETHTGPLLMANLASNPFLYDLTLESLDQIKTPRPKTRIEVQELADKMNSYTEFHNKTHKVVIYKGKNRADKPAPKAQLQSFTPVFLLPTAKVGRPRKVGA